MKIDDIRQATRSFSDIARQLKSELNRLDRDLKSEILSAREKEIRAKHEPGLNALRVKIREGKATLEQQRKKESDPRTALLRKAWQRAGEITPGHMIVLDSFRHMGTRDLLDFAKEFNNPVVTLRALDAITDKDLSPVERLTYSQELLAAAAAFVDKAAIDELARAEILCNETALLELDLFGGVPVQKLTVARELEALQKIIESKTVQVEYRDPSLEYPDPRERLDAGHAAN